MLTATPVQAVPPVLAALRQATQHTHKSVEKLTPFFRPEFDRQAYLQWLDLMHGFYLHVDHAVQNSGFASATGWQYEARCGLIVRDIAVLAGRAPHTPADLKGMLAGIRALTQTGQIAGMLYVVEGSALGGQVLLKVFERRAGVTATAGGTFFAPHGDPPQPRWAAYVQLLARLSTSQEFEQDAVNGAVTTFTLLQDWIGQGWHPDLISPPG